MANEYSRLNPTDLNAPGKDEKKSIQVHIQKIIQMAPSSIYKKFNLLDFFISGLLVFKIKRFYLIIEAPLLKKAKMVGQFMAGRHQINFSYPQKAVSLVSLSHKVAFTGVCPLQVAECITGQPFFATLKNTWTCVASRRDSREKLLSCKDSVMSVFILPDILHDM